MEATVEYRNIDTDYVLYRVVSRYWSGEISLDQVYWKLESEGYSKREIELAIYDYYLVYIRTNKIQNVFMFVCIFSLIIYLVYFLVKSVNNL